MAFERFADFQTAGNVCSFCHGDLRPDDFVIDTGIFLEWEVGRVQGCSTCFMDVAVNQLGLADEAVSTKLKAQVLAAEAARARAERKVAVLELQLESANESL